MDELVKPVLPIIDYLTAYSGITEEMLRDVSITLYLLILLYTLILIVLFVIDCLVCVLWVYLQTV